jgi:UPF0755 protein
MGLFERKPPPRDRTPEERERARAERAARRAQREGLSDAEAAPPPLEVPPPAGATPPPSPRPAARSSATPTRPPAAPARAASASAAPATREPPPAPATPRPDADGGAPARVGGERPAPPSDADGGAPARVDGERPALPSGADGGAPARLDGPRPPAPRAVDGDGAVQRDRGGVEAPSVVLDAEPAEDWSALDAPARRRRVADRLRARRAGGRRPAAAGRPERRRRWPLAMVAVAAVAVLAAGWFAVSLLQPFHGDGNGEAIVTIPRGATIGQAGDLLAEEGVVSSAFFFKLRAKLDGPAEIKSGTYHLPRDISYGAAFDALAKGPPPARTTSITITEGRTVREVDRLLRRTSLRGGYAAAVRSSRVLSPRRYGAPRRVRTLEGFLFPATYQVRVGAPVSDLVTRQLQAFKRSFAGVSLAYARSKNLTPYDVLIIASMIEREAAVPKDRRLIASVIYNRLQQGIPLGIDATIRYQIGNWSRPLRQSELQRDTPYNTRLNQGLPPTPIGNPGLASIRAAANPARTRFLYFVVKPCGKGEHVFTRTDAEFQRAAQRYERARQARGGSPVDC